MQTKPKTTLFMISSLDGKISSGDTEKVDVDQDWKRIKGLKEGLHQYYDLEKQTDFTSFITGKVLAKIGVNKRTGTPTQIPVRFVVVDNKPHLNKKGVEYFSKLGKHLFIVTTNAKHPAFALAKKLDTITVIHHKKSIDFKKLFVTLKTIHKVNRLTIQSGGTLNAVLLRAGLIDRVSLVIAPVLVGGSTTPTLIDGEAIHSVKELSKMKVLKLVKVNKLKNSYLHLVYEVLPKTTVK